MELNKTLIPEDYDGLLYQYKSVRKELEEVKQNLYDSTRQLKVKEALLVECQGEIDHLQNGESSKKEKLETKISFLEETLTNLRSNHSLNILQLETDLDKKQKVNEELQKEVEFLKRKNSLELKGDVSVNLDELVNLRNENELLKENCEDLRESFDDLQRNYTELKEILSQYKEEVSQLKETLDIKREELSENVTLIEKLTDELFCTNRELESFKNKPLDQASKGNSLFAEVDDRRVHLQQTINKMKSDYIRLTQEQSQHLKLISHLRKENATLCENWKKDLAEMEEDQPLVMESLRDRIKVLEEIVEKQKKELEEKPRMPTENLSKEFEFYEHIIDSKNAEIKEMEQRLSSQSLNKYLLANSLAKANKEIRKWRLEAIQKQQEVEIKLENVTKPEVTGKNTIGDFTRPDIINIEHGTRIDERQSILARQENRGSSMPFKSCVKRRDTIFVTEDNKTDEVKEEENKRHPRGGAKFDESLNYKRVSSRRETAGFNIFNSTEGSKDKVEESLQIIKHEPEEENLILFEDKENLEMNTTEVESNARKGVTFSANTVDPVSNPMRKRGTRIFTMKKNHAKDQ